MTVKELITKLLEANMDSKVYLQGYNYGVIHYRDVEEASEFNMARINDDDEVIGLHEDYPEQGSCWAVIIE